MKSDEFDSKRCWEDVELHLIDLMGLLFEWYTTEKGKATTLESKLKQAWCDVSKIYAELWAEVNGDKFWEIMERVGVCDKKVI